MSNNKRTLVYFKDMILMETYEEVKNNTILKVENNYFFVYKIIRSMIPGYYFTAYVKKVELNDEERKQ